MFGELPTSRPGHLSLGEGSSVTHWVGSWTDSMNGLDIKVKRDKF
jgi:hypothetical protein